MTSPSDDELRILYQGGMIEEIMNFLMAKDIMTMAEYNQMKEKMFRHMDEVRKRI